MAGREPQPPADWEETPDSGPDDGSATAESDVKPTIGGPASEH